MAAFSTELEIQWIGKVTLRAQPFEFVSAITTKFNPFRIIETTFWTLHFLTQTNLPPAATTVSRLNHSGNFPMTNIIRPRLLFIDDAP